MELNEEIFKVQVMCIFALWVSFRVLGGGWGSLFMGMLWGTPGGMGAFLMYHNWVKFHQALVSSYEESKYIELAKLLAMFLGAWGTVVIVSVAVGVLLVRLARRL